MQQLSLNDNDMQQVVTCMDDTQLDGVLDDLENSYLENRSQLVQRNGLVSTPLHALKEIASFHEETIHQEITCVPMEGKFKPLILAEIIVGRFRG